MAIVEHEPDSVDWLDEEASTALIAHLFKPHIATWRFKQQECEDAIASMPVALLRHLFVYTMLDAEAHFNNFEGENGNYIIPSYTREQLRCFVPRQDR